MSDEELYELTKEVQEKDRKTMERFKRPAFGRLDKQYQERAKERKDGSIKRNSGNYINNN